MSRLKELRKKKKFTQIKIQMETGIDQSNYSKIERGVKEITYRECKALALLFDTSMDYLAEITDIAEPYPRNNKKRLL